MLDTPLSRSRIVAALTALALLGSTLAAGFTAQAAPARDEVERCQEMGGSERFCKSLEALGAGAAQACRQALTDNGPGPGLADDDRGTAPGDTACAEINGAVISSDLVDAYHATWMHEAHRLQRELGDGLPFRTAQWVASHNTYNSASEPNTLSGTDANQSYSIYDQLRMDVRMIELDVHWFPSPHGTPATQGRAPLLCHGNAYHAGCTFERPVADGFAEVRRFLDENPGEVIVLDLENRLEDDPFTDVPVAYETTIAEIERFFGPRIWRPADSASVSGHSGACDGGLPMDVTRNHVRASGKQVIVISSCDANDPGGWPQLVHNYGPGRKQTSTPQGYLASSDCFAGLGNANRTADWLRYWEDATWVSVMAADSPLAGSRPDPIDGPTASKMIRCGVNTIGLDQILPGDERFPALIWSWAADQPAGHGCVLHNAEGRFEVASVTQCGLAGKPNKPIDPATGKPEKPAAKADRSQPAACRLADGSWALSAPTRFMKREAACAALGGVASVPTHGWDNELLRSAKQAAGVASAWLDLEV